jgi:hypothetical protein
MVPPTIIGSQFDVVVMPGRDTKIGAPSVKSIQGKLHRGAARTGLPIWQQTDRQRAWKYNVHVLRRAQ